MILHILKNLPKEFETVVEICEEVLPRRENSLTTVKKCVSDYGIIDQKRTKKASMGLLF
jgi:hypothetical protein